MEQTYTLMIKECNKTGLKYLCKCASHIDPYRYRGSGIRWINHLKKYHQPWTNPSLTTTILHTNLNKRQLKILGQHYSDLYGIVKSNNWANLIAETGDGGWINDQTGKTWKIKDTSKMSNKKTITDAVIAARDSISGTNNHQFIGYYVTPYGTFESLTSAVNAAKLLQVQGRKDVLLSAGIVKKYCITENNIKLNSEGRRIYPKWRGKTPKEIGFDFIKKEDNGKRN